MTGLKTGVKKHVLGGWQLIHRCPECFEGVIDYLTQEPSAAKVDDMQAAAELEMDDSKYHKKNCRLMKDWQPPPKPATSQATPTPSRQTALSPREIYKEIKARDREQGVDGGLPEPDAPVR